MHEDEIRGTCILIPVVSPFVLLRQPLSRRFTLLSPLPVDQTLAAIAEQCQPEHRMPEPQQKPFIGSVYAPSFQLEVPARGILAVRGWGSCTLTGTVLPAGAGALVSVRVQPDLALVVSGISVASVGFYLTRQEGFWLPLALSGLIFLGCRRSSRKIAPVVSEVFARSLGISQNSYSLFDYAEANRRAADFQKSARIVKPMLLGIFAIWVLANLLSYCGVLSSR